MSEKKSDFRFPMFESFKDKLKPNRSETQMALANVRIFEKLSWSEIRSIENSIHVRNFSPGETVFKQGDPGSGMYIIVRGSVGIFLEIPNEEPQKLTELNEGDFFGEIALLDEAPRSAGAIAMESSAIIGFYRPDLMNLLQIKPQLGAKILLALSEVLATRLRATDEQLVKVTRQLSALMPKEDDV